MKIRRYLRQALVQTALLKLPDSEEIPCEIRNFCQAGLFLKLIRPSSIPEATSLTSLAEVVFISYKAETIFRLSGRLSHVSQSGAGIVFDRPPPFQILQALQEVALADPLAERSLPADHAEIQERCAQALEQLLRTLAGKLTVQIEIELRKETDGHISVATDTGLDEPLSAEDQAKQVIERFSSYAIAQAKNFVVPDLSLQPESGVIYTESRPEQLVFKDWMNLMDKIIHLESKNDATLKVLESRFSVLAQRNITNHNNPFGPSVLLHTFHYAMKEVHLTNAQREIIYGTLTHLFDEGLDRLYRELRLLSKPLEPFVAKQSLVLLDHPVAVSPYDDDSLSTAAAKTDEDWQGIARTLRQSPAPRGLPTTPAKQYGNIKATQLRKPTAAGKQHQSPDTHHLETIPHQPDAFTAFVVLTRYAEGQANKGSSEAADNFDRFEIIDALAKQLQAAGRNQPIPYFSAPKLQTDLSQILTESGQEKVFSSREVKENLQILGLLLDAMLADLSTPACIAPYIMKLQIPLLIASFADPGLLYGQTHPGREILNQLDCLTQAANSQGEFDNPQMLQSLDTLFNRIIKEVANNPQVFAEVLEEMEKLTAPLLKTYSTRLERLVEACEGGQRLEHSRQSVDREVDLRIGGKTVPSVVLSLLDAGWRQLLVLTNLRQGTESDDWRRQLASLDLLISWLGAQGTSSPPSPSNIQSLKQYLREGLSGVNVEPVEVNLVLEKIDKLLPEDDSQPSPSATIDIPPADTTRMERENALRFRLAGFRVGDWLKFISTQNVWIPLRLAWIGQEPGRYVFANRKGIKTLELDATKFAQILDEKRASRIESLDNLSLVERTAKSLLSTLRDRLR